MNPDYKTRYLAKLNGQFIHASLQCLTPNKKWAWVGTKEKVDRAKRKSQLVAQADIKLILRNVQLKTNGVMQ